MDNKHIGEQSITKYKQTMTIIAYRNYNDIDVQFEDGTIVEHKTYFYFQAGRIKNPNCHNITEGNLNELQKNIKEN